MRFTFAPTNLYAYSPVIVSSFATSMRTSSLRQTEAPMSGISPHRDSIMEMRQSGVENRKSAPSATCKPS